jgi:hypothetical protein
MARVCHTNNCPVGVASQREELRARFPGAPADLVNFFHFVAEEVRGLGNSVWGLGLRASGVRVCSGVSPTREQWGLKPPYSHPALPPFTN